MVVAWPDGYSQIKVFVQVECGRHAISTGQATMDALQEVPGPRILGV